MWWKLIRGHLDDIGLIIHPIYDCFFRKLEANGSVTFLILHVDDILGQNDNPDPKIRHVLRHFEDLCKQLRATDPNPLNGNLFLGVRYSSLANGAWSANQVEYIERLVKRIDPVILTKQTIVTTMIYRQRLARSPSR
ncbi:hypothetical protein TL16_g00645 [Triparma laevis f. inornata]|uniref:Reverse transcriptase n=2 Tax=Triparma laevis TaxID=1534972 RepID=A0A9W7FRE0_9STRA|nr:hypothetical protein TL16_g00645 [Triparma laevis f. inornata]GMI16947.1 hypothetical protein TrLO_g9811 [Triparma laevis f. longispina]